MDWNLVVTTYDHGFDRAAEALRDFGSVHRTNYFNVLVLQVEDREECLERLGSRARMVPDLFTHCISRVAPAHHAFDFGSAEEYEERTRRAARSLAPRLAGKSFHVRAHRRGFGNQLSGDEMERSLADAVYTALQEEGREEPEVTFDDPDAVVVVDTVDGRAGISLWTREELERYPFLDPN